ncbi:uncharacterized protein EI97DRAFT_428394 [Westerdykella ornata]|uniref:Transcriptional regulator n=1 Tax=Westerdykella ornata TaxID=318751 RepID=A0A6A6J6V6_WESOR|nr:uncharacterized protein EI97DRAFT_428394 [Westerdykella ornata]KAF2271366.1 hypothetical protein EI97DRAFT_428394 [Westerdykella ornata]
MSDSDDSPNVPPDSIISRTLRDVVIGLHKSGNHEDLTVKRVRARAEEQLGLPSGFLKSDQNWKQKSSDLIHEAVDKYCGDEPASPESSPAKPARTKARPTKTEDVEAGRPQKRKAAAPTKKPKKRAKVVESSDELSDAAGTSPPPKEETVSEAESESPKAKKVVRRPRKVVNEEEPEGANQEEARSATPVNRTKDGGMQDRKANDSDSDLSSLIDESPVKRKRQKKSPSEKRTKAAKPKAPGARSKSKAAEEEDPDQAEIKRLQGWLLKCGIRKVWGKELAKYATPREKIKHLKDMLKDAGMEGKYSVEKAARIKEQRELAKDLEAIQEVAQRWGNTEEGGRPRRRAAAAASKITLQDFNDDDEEDSANEKESGDENDDDGTSDAHVSGDDSANDQSDEPSGAEDGDDSE